ncbi:tyrosine-type recombinase/integrase [Robertmurraya andreesenii]|uniref:Integrase/recombinase XerD n=1 Tax=Anoxybacillus andreesenii TaxID=1325932 RepID=A0ABT9V015_9BACL|nr:tyrosine-type recombinase/integrase [Robertmurraya andreesenii]MDQ0154245.1 integrase/recombinase XerD [Robertmurraya andreesenii]
MSVLNRYWESTNESIPNESRTILNEYLLSLKLENKAVATITKYRRFLERFLKECKIPIEELSSEDVRKWLDKFSVDKKPKTVDLVLATLSSFFSFCLKEEYMETTVMKKRWKPKIPKALPKYLDEHEYAHVKRIAEQLSVRNRALLLFLFATGCRVSEASNLNIEDVNINKRTAEVTGKGGKIRHVHFSEECALVLKEYLQTRNNEPTEPFFMNKFGQRLLKGGIQQVLKKVGIKANLRQSFHPHVCRHTFATNMLARGADLQFIADEMGHFDLNTTRIYARIPTEDMKLKYQNIMG